MMADLPPRILVRGPDAWRSGESVTAVGVDEELFVHGDLVEVLLQALIAAQADMSLARPHLNLQDLQTQLEGLATVRAALAKYEANK